MTGTCFSARSREAAQLTDVLQGLGAHEEVVSVFATARRVTLDRPRSC